MGRAGSVLVTSSLAELPDASVLDPERLKLTARLCYCKRRSKSGTVVGLKPVRFGLLSFHGDSSQEWGADPSFPTAPFLLPVRPSVSFDVSERL